MHWINTQLRLKIIAWSFIPTAIILFLVALTAYLVYQETARDLIYKRDEELTRLMASEISTSFEDFIDRLSALSRAPGLAQDDPAAIKAALADFKGQVVFMTPGYM